MSTQGIATPQRRYTDPDGGDWTDEAACRGADIDRFFPEPGRGATAIYEAAREEYCDGCPVRLPCLRRGEAGETRAKQRQGRHGLFGGLTPVERADRALVARVLAELELERAVSRA
ncbi:WhiB family transcriptional regulator [Parafrankia sp. FMc6]|uniref:WhiB family transcriptional regulator n=1 Tax=Parafrankia soli TaxID=2599596 RepID=UPI0034D73F48